MSRFRVRKLSRREFLVLSGTAGVGLFLGVRLGAPALRLRIAETLADSDGSFGTMPSEPFAWFEITPENQVLISIPKSEMGQGIHTALAQIAAEDLGVDWEQVLVVQAGSDSDVASASITAGSNSVTSLYLPLRQAAATLQNMLHSEAARQLNVNTGALIALQGSFYVDGEPNTQITYAQIVAVADEWVVPEEAPTLKPMQDFQIIGEALPRVDLRDKILGSAVYGYDARLPGMHYGALASPQTLDGHLVRARPGSANEMPGVVRVVIEGEIVGVVAESRAQAHAALSALDLEWDAGRNWQQEDIEGLVTVGNGLGVVIQSEGDAEPILEAEQTIRAEYRSPLAFHAHLEPPAALADVRSDGVGIWASTQSSAALRTTISKLLDRDEESVVVTPTYLGGGFGHKIDETVAKGAAVLSDATGKPVHVGWNRSEDFHDSFLRPPTHHVLQAVLNNAGSIEAFEHQQASGDVAFPFMPGIVATVMGADFGAWRGATVAYGIPNRRAQAWRTEIPIRTGWWRGLGLLANTFAIESFMDELAHASGTDPLQFRLQHLPDGALGMRYQTVLETLGDKSDWESAPPAGRARGLAICNDVKTIVGQVAEVSIEAGEIRVHKVTAVVDPGLIINPDGATTQTEGAIMMGLSSTLIEQVTLKDGRLQADNFDRYPLLTIDRSPDVDVFVIQSGEVPYGMGEPPIGPVAAAVANAVFSLTGERLRELPLHLT